MAPSARTFQEANASPADRCSNHRVVDEIFAVLSAARQRPRNRDEAGILTAVQLLESEHLHRLEDPIRTLRHTQW